MTVHNPALYNPFVFHEQVVAESKRSCHRCGRNVTHANTTPQRLGDDRDAFVCCDIRTATGMLHPGVCCACWDGVSR